MSRMGVEFAIAGVVLWLVASGGVGAATESNQGVHAIPNFAERGDADAVRSTK
jgi:hypothetical protein